MKLMPRLYVAALLLPVLAIASSLTNTDIVKMSEAKLDEAIILTAIESSDPKFDTSSQGLIELSNAKVSSAIIAAIIKRNSSSGLAPVATPAPGANPAPTATTTATDGELMSPSDIFMIDGEETRPMRYLNAQIRTGMRALGFAGVVSYAVLRGSEANARIVNKQPGFLVSVPNQAQVESYLTLASFAVRKNNSREVLIGGGYMTYSSGIHPDRIIAVTSEKSTDQSRAQKGFTIYKVTPKNPMPVGEYAVILYTGELHGMVATWFTGTGNSYFDFGIDP